MSDPVTDVTRPNAPAGPGRSGRTVRSVVVILAATAVTVVVIGAAQRFAGSPEHDHHDHDHDHDHGHDGRASIGDAIELDRAVVRVDGVRPEVMAAMNMPASLMPDHVPEGFRRFAVDMFVTATSEEGFDPTPDLFTVSGDVLAPTAPHRAIVDPDRVPQGFSAVVSMLFQVPLDAEPLSLHIDGADVEVLLDGDLGSGHVHDEAPADLVVSGRFEAEIRDAAFVPDRLLVAAGTTVTFHNHDQTTHDVTFIDGSSSSGPLRPDGRSAGVTFDEPGQFEYRCSIHPSMTGTIVVVPG